MFASRPALFLFFVLFLRCEQPIETEISILFVGNSLTYVNDLPSLVAGIGKMDGVNVGVTSIVAGNYSLDDHWLEGTIQSALEKGNYDFLVAQQGPSALPESQVLLREASIKIANECRVHNTTFALYMVWPSLARDFDRDNCISSYTNAATASGALLCPAGLAWKLAWQKDKNIPFYGPDDFHPGIHGSLLAAMSIYVAITNKKDLDFMKKPDGVSKEQFDIMKTAALEANKIK